METTAELLTTSQARPVVNFQLSYEMAGCYSSDVLSWQETSSNA